MTTNNQQLSLLDLAGASSDRTPALLPVVDAPAVVAPAAGGKGGSRSNALLATKPAARFEQHQMVTRDGQICDICDKPEKLHANGRWVKPE